MIPPRGCAFIVMKTRHEANYAVRKMKHMRLGGKVTTIITDTDTCGRIVALVV